jgi:hypothetical protein
MGVKTLSADSSVDLHLCLILAVLSIHNAWHYVKESPLKRECSVMIHYSLG